MILVVPCFENHELTAQMVASLAETVRGDFTLVIVDNASPTPYRTEDYAAPFQIKVIRNRRNEGNFWPLRQGADSDPHQTIVALAHNDLIYYEVGWDLRVEQAFHDEPRLGMLGFAGSDEIGADGKRASTMSNLRGTRGHASAEAIGTRITDLHPAVAVDGLFMAFRRRVLSHLTLAPSMPPAHYFDFIWGAQVIRAGWRLATLGIECDHVGWSTEVKLASALDAEWRGWCIEHGYDPGADPMAVIRAVGERDWQWLRGRFWPCRIGAGWLPEKTGLVAGISMFHNEEDVAGHVIRHMLDECDFVVVADNNSDDGSRAALEALDNPRLHIQDELSFAYNQAETMTRLSDEARALGAVWVVPFDFDEWWDSPGGRLADVLRGLPEDLDLVTARTSDMIPQVSDSANPNPFERITMTRPGSLWSTGATRKAAFQPGPGRVLLQGNHGIVGREPWTIPVGPIRIRHYPFRTIEQARAKVTHGREAILAAKLPTNSGTHWQQWGALSEEDFRAWWAEWTDPEGLVPWADGTRVIIAAAGSDERWDGYLGVRRPEIVIDGEPLLGRMVRLLRCNGVSDIIISGPFPDYAPSIMPAEAVDLMDGRLGVRDLWNSGGRTVILLGDVFYSDEAIRAIVGHTERDLHLFARFGPSHFTAKPWAEIFAVSFWPEHHAAHEASLRTVNEMRDRGELARGGLWESYLLDHDHLFDGINGDAGQVGNFGNATEIDDWTEDFDFPVDYDLFMAHRAAA